MLVILMDDQIFTPEQVCQSCVFASNSGEPRWHGGQLHFGQAIRKFAEQRSEQYEFVMGFRIAHIK
jgi:hypothetical protein